MQAKELIERLEGSPVIAAVHGQNIQEALESPAEVIFALNAHILSVGECVRNAHEKGKPVLVHVDLAEGISRDRAGLAYLKSCGVDGILTTHGSTVRMAKEMGLITVQRFFALDSQGVNGIGEAIEFAQPDLIEIMPGTVSKVIKKFASRGIPVIAGGLIETKQEATDALSAGAIAVSTGSSRLWYL